MELLVIVGNMIKIRRMSNNVMKINVQYLYSLLQNS